MSEPEQYPIDDETKTKLTEQAQRRGISVAQLLRERAGLDRPSRDGASHSPAAPAKSMREKFAERMDMMFDMWMMRGMGMGTGMGGMGGAEAPKSEDPMDEYIRQLSKIRLAKMLNEPDSPASKELDARADQLAKEYAERMAKADDRAAQIQTSLEEYKKEAERREHERALKEIEDRRAADEARWQQERTELREELSELRNEIKTQPKPPSDLDMLDRATQTMVSVEERRAALRRALSGMAGYAKDAEEKGNKTDAEKVKEWIELISEGAATATDILGRAQGIRKASPPAAPAQGTPPGSNYPAQPPTQASPEPQLPPARVDEAMYVEADTGRVLSHSQWMAKYGAPPILLDQPGAPPPTPPPAEPTPAPKEAPAPPASPPSPPATPPEPGPSEAPPPASSPAPEQKPSQPLQGDEV